MKCPRCDGTELSSAGGDGSYYYYRCKKCDPEKKGKPFRAPKPLPSYNRAKTAPAVPGAPEAAPAGKAAAAAAAVEGVSLTAGSKRKLGEVLATEGRTTKGRAGG